MEALTFTLSGSTAFFKKPDVNTYAYFTYNNIHKIALLGIIGAIIGLNGYKQQNEDKYPEFYDKLKDLKISIVPLSINGYFSKKIQVFNNSTGFYNKDSKRHPCTLNYREQWLYNPQWKIYILNDNSIDKNLYKKISDYILNKKCEYIPYLGKNDHYAEINDSAIVTLEESKDISKITSIFIDNPCIIKLETANNDNNAEESLSILKETLPVKLNDIDNAYEFNDFIFTNLLIQNYSTNIRLYKHLRDILYFF